MFYFYKIDRHKGFLGDGSNQNLDESYAFNTSRQIVNWLMLLLSEKDTTKYKAKHFTIKGCVQNGPKTEDDENRENKINKTITEKNLIHIQKNISTYSSRYFF